MYAFRLMQKYYLARAHLLKVTLYYQHTHNAEIHALIQYIYSLYACNVAYVAYAVRNCKLIPLPTAFK